jgi:hypothetical protein
MTMFQQISSRLQCDTCQAVLSATFLPKCHKHCSWSSPRRVIILSQAKQNVGSKFGGAPSLSLKGLKRAFSKDDTGSRRVSADERIVVIDAPSSSGRDHTSIQRKGKPSRVRPAAVGSIRHHNGKGSMQSKISNDSTERLAKASHPPDIYMSHPGMSSSAVPCTCFASP